VSAAAAGAGASSASIHGLPGVGGAGGAVPRHSSSRIPRAKTEIAKLQGVVELTSIINMIDLETQHREALGSKPLVDLDAGPRLYDPAPEPRTQPPQPPPGRMDSRAAVRTPGRTSARTPIPGSGGGASAPRGAEAPAPMPSSPRLTSSPALTGSPAPRVQHFPAPARGTTRNKSKKRSLLQTWLVVIAILLAAAVAGVVVAMSGPDVAVQRGK
jgi:hypothetical protein